MGVLAALLGLLGTAATGLFGFKQTQGSIIQAALGTINNINSSEAEKAQAYAMLVAAEANSQSWLTRTWRPLIMWIFTGLLVSYWFGFVPPAFYKPMPPQMTEIFSLIKFGLGYYMIGRTGEKIASIFTSNSALLKIIGNYIIKKIV